MKEYKITKERLEAMAEECPEAKEVLKRGFPEAFEEEWEDITGQLQWKLQEACVDRGMYWVRGYEGDELIVFLNVTGIELNAGVDNHKYKIEEGDFSFRVLKRRGK